MTSVSLFHYDWIANHALRRGGALAAIDLGTDRRFSYAEFHRRIDGVAACLAADFAVSVGDRVAVLAESSTDVFEIQFACFRLGAIFVPLNWRLASAELSAILANCAPKLLVHDAGFADRVASLGSDAQALMTGEGSAYERAAQSDARPSAYAEMRLEDTATILYTSGTTGLPKGVIVTYAMNLFNAIMINALANVSSRTVFLVVLPLFHTAGLNVYTNPTFHAGGTNIVMRNFDPGAALAALGDPALGITHFFGVPAHYQFPMQHPAFTTTDFSRLEMAGVGGAPAPVSIISGWQAQGVPLTQGFGMTETGPIVLYLDKEDAARKIGSAGKPAMHVAVRLLSADGVEVSDNEIGELVLRGPAITPGYWNNPEATAAAIPDGWLRTGDAAIRDSEGYYFIVDRWKDMYITGGENVYPAEVENVLHQMEEIAEAAVIGVASERWGETGRAVIVLKPGRSLTADAVIAHCLARLARYKLPAEVVFTDALPRNATGKVHKPTLRGTFGAAV